MCTETCPRMDDEKRKIWALACGASLLCWLWLCSMSYVLWYCLAVRKLSLGMECGMGPPVLDSMKVLCLTSDFSLYHSSSLYQTPVWNGLNCVGSSVCRVAPLFRAHPPMTAPWIDATNQLIWYTISPVANIIIDYMIIGPVRIQSRCCSALDADSRPLCGPLMSDQSIRSTVSRYLWVSPDI